MKIEGLLRPSCPPPKSIQNATRFGRRGLVFRTSSILLRYFEDSFDILWSLTDAILSKRQKGFTKVKVQYFFTGCRFYPFGFRFPWPYITCGGQESITKLMARASSDAKMNGQMWKCEIQKKQLKMFQGTWAVKSQQSAKFSLASITEMWWAEDLLAP